jgi:hypothetical protein
MLGLRVRPVANVEVINLGFFTRWRIIEAHCDARRRPQSLWPVLAGVAIEAGPADPELLLVSQPLVQHAQPHRTTRSAVFAGGFDLPAAEAVGGGGEIERNDALALLTCLVDKSLVQVEERQPAELRYRLLEPVRQYAGQRLQASGEVEAVHRRHAVYFLSLAETAEPELHGVDQAAWFDRLARDFDNMRTALSWALDCQDAETALRLVGALREFLWVRSHISEGRGWTERVLALADAPEVADSDRVWAKALITAGQLPLFQGDYPLACERFEQSVARSRRAGDSCGLALSLAFLGAPSWPTPSASLRVAPPR